MHMHVAYSSVEQQFWFHDRLAEHRLILNFLYIAQGHFKIVLSPAYDEHIG